MANFDYLQCSPTPTSKSCMEMKHGSLKLYMISAFGAIVEIWHALSTFWDAFLPFALLWWNVMLYATCVKYYSWNWSRRLKGIKGQHAHEGRPSHEEWSNGVESHRPEFDSRLDDEDGSCKAAIMESHIAPAGAFSSKLSSLCVYEGEHLQSLSLSASQWAAFSLLQRLKQQLPLLAMHDVQHPYNLSEGLRLEVWPHNNIMLELRGPMLANQFIINWLMYAELLPARVFNGNHEGRVLLTCIDNKVNNSDLTRIFLMFESQTMNDDEPIPWLVPSINTINAIIKGIQGLDSRLGEQQSLAHTKIEEQTIDNDEDGDDDFYGGDNHETIDNDSDDENEGFYGDGDDDFYGGDNHETIVNDNSDENEGFYGSCGGYFYGGANHETIDNDNDGVNEGFYSGDDDDDDHGHGVNEGFCSGDDDDDDDGHGKENKDQLLDTCWDDDDDDDDHGEENKDQLLDTWWDEDAVLLDEQGEDDGWDQAWLMV